MDTKEKPRRRAPEKKTAPKKSAQDVVYLPPKPLERGRILLHLASVAAIVLALIIGVSLFFKVEEVRVSGNLKYSAWDISQASGIQTGDNLITLSRAGATGRIISALPYVKSARIGIKLPNTVNIYIEEVEVTYAIADSGGSWWLVSAEGKVIDKTLGGEESGSTKLLGVKLQDPKVGEAAAALEDAPVQTDPEGNQIPQTVSKAKYLKTLLDIAQYLELNGMIGKAVSIDITDPRNIELWYGKRFLVLLGDETQLGYKISYLKGAVEKLSDYQSGTLDLSFAQNEQAVFTPFQ